MMRFKIYVLKFVLWISDILVPPEKRKPKPNPLKGPFSKLVPKESGHEHEAPEFRIYTPPDWTSEHVMQNFEHPNITVPRPGSYWPISTTKERMLATVYINLKARSDVLCIWEIHYTFGEGKPEYDPRTIPQQFPGPSPSLN